MDLLELSAGIPPLITQRRRQDFGFAALQQLRFPKGIDRRETLARTANDPPWRRSATAQAMTTKASGLSFCRAWQEAPAVSVGLRFHTRRGKLIPTAH
jgi:hypothetical protein